MQLRSELKTFIVGGPGGTCPSGHSWLHHGKVGIGWLAFSTASTVHNDATYPGSLQGLQQGHGLKTQHYDQNWSLMTSFDMQGPTSKAKVNIPTQKSRISWQEKTTQKTMAQADNVTTQTGDPFNHLTLQVSLSLTWRQCKNAAPSCLSRQHLHSVWPRRVLVHHHPQLQLHTKMLADFSIWTSTTSCHASPTLFPIIPITFSWVTLLIQSQPVLNFT